MPTQRIFLDQPTDCCWSPTCNNEALTTQLHPVNGNVPICGSCLLAYDEELHLRRTLNKKAVLVLAAYAMVGLSLCLFSAYRPDQKPATPETDMVYKWPTATK